MVLSIDATDMARDVPQQGYRGSTGNLNYLDYSSRYPCLVMPFAVIGNILKKLSGAKTISPVAPINL
jgi:hypothetical protein